LHYALKFTAPVDGEGKKMWWRDYVYEEEVPIDD
jgi:aromatic ring hydroxylase